MIKCNRRALRWLQAVVVQVVPTRPVQVGARPVARLGARQRAREAVRVHRTGNTRRARPHDGRQPGDGVRQHRLPHLRRDEDGRLRRRTRLRYKVDCGSIDFGNVPLEAAVGTRPLSRSRTMPGLIYNAGKLQLAGSLTVEKM